MSKSSIDRKDFSLNEDGNLEILDKELASLVSGGGTGGLEETAANRNWFWCDGDMNQGDCRNMRDCSGGQNTGNCTNDQLCATEQL